MIKGGRKNSSAGKEVQTMLLPKDSPVKYWLLAKEFSSLLPIDSDRSAQGHVVLSFLASIRVMEMNTLSQVQKYPTFQKSWYVKIILRPYISNNCNIVCFCIFMWLNFYAGAKTQEWHIPKNKTNKQTV